VQNRGFLSHDEQFGPPLFLPFYRDIVPEKMDFQNMENVMGHCATFCTQMVLFKSALPAKHSKTCKLLL
jgi:hypothetical protein